jgi:pilus assembly protein Flp/PilA
MLSNKKSFASFAKRQSGVTMIEYALIAALIAVVVALVLTPLGAAIAAKFQEVTAALG